ncbi:uncharacterized protein TNCV_3668721 [Trichonephila clavipes]|nr:uncharacterized protein TNCV_3668721 [Trichonephila clavipes]
MNSTESAKRPSGKRPKKMKFTGNMHTRCKAVHSVDESLNNSAYGKRFGCKMFIHLFIEHDCFDGYRVFDKTIMFTSIENFASCKQCGGDIKLSEKNVLEDVILETKKGVTCLQKVENSYRKECLKNHNGPAGMMETVGMVRIFQRSLSHRSVRYTSYIGDCDSKTFSSITVSNPYGEDITVSKLNVLDMFKKRMGTRLRKLKQMSYKLSDGKSIGGKEG